MHLGETCNLGEFEMTERNGSATSLVDLQHIEIALDFYST